MVSLQEISETHTAIDEYLVTTYVEAAVECILTKPRVKSNVP